MSVNGTSLLTLGSMVFPGSVIKAERVMRVVRKSFRAPAFHRDYDASLERLVWSLRFSAGRRAKQAASFLAHLKSSYGDYRIQQLYVERKSYSRRYRPASRGRVAKLRSPHYRIVAMLRPSEGPLGPRTDTLQGSDVA